MTVTLPDDPALADLTEAEIRLDLACALFAFGRISRPVATRLAGIPEIDFDTELVARRIPSCWEATLAEDLSNLRELFPR